MENTFSGNYEKKTAHGCAERNRRDIVARTTGLRFLQGALIGLGAVLPGISGGVLCVVFGVYRTIMELLSNPFRTLKKQYRLLIPLILGGGFGFIVVARVLGYFLVNYPDPSVCLFVGLIGGMLPSLFREAGMKEEKENGKVQSHSDRKKEAIWNGVSLVLCFVAVFGLLLGLNLLNIRIVPNTGWYLFCGFCIALSVIAPGMSFSTLLMPLGLYTPLVSGIGNFDLYVIVPAGVGALLTVALLARAVNILLEHYYSITFHGIIGIVMAATVVIIPFGSFSAGIRSCAGNSICLVTGIAAALLLDRFNRRIEVSVE